MKTQRLAGRPAFLFSRNNRFSVLAEFTIEPNSRACSVFVPKVFLDLRLNRLPLLTVPHHIENELLSRIAAGDEAAFKEMHDLYWNDVYSLALAFTKSPQAAEDLVQEVFIKLWMKRDALGHVENFRAFFKIMVRNHVISALRKNKKQERDLQAFIKTANPVEPHLIAPEVNEAVRLVAQIISRLPARQQQIFRMSREQGLNHDDIASRLNVSKKTVSNTITIILALIRKHLYKNDLLLAGIVCLTGSL